MSKRTIGDFWHIPLSWIFLLFICVITSSNYVDEAQPHFEELPFCNDATHDDKKYVLISTLDGSISALNIKDGGSLSWSMNTGEAPMLSSSIHRLELTSNGQYVRMIPSLSGNLYKFDGKFVEPVPINANHLLKNSFRYSEDLVISGGRETMTYGVDLDSGKVIYECTLKGCERNFTGQDSESQQVLVVQRQTQTIRALEPRTGLERWNFSVAQHDVKLLNDPNSECHFSGADKLDDLSIRVVVPDGLVCALSKKNPSVVVWKHKFKFPVVHAWRYSRNKMQPVDLFSGAISPTLRSLPSAPALYVGMHEKQVYIQESVQVQYGVAEEMIPLIDSRGRPTKIPWRPYAASPIGAIGSSSIPLLTDESVDSNMLENTALSQSVLYGSEYANGNGFYLFRPVEGKVCDKNSTVEDSDDNIPLIEMTEEEETPVQIVIVSLWYWWKEVLIICATTTIVSNFFCTQRYLLLRQRFNDYVNMERRSAQSSDSGLSVGRISNRSNSEGDISPNFSSRYQEDFEQIRCLGKGGFGVVFEARNKIDDCHYAIKRIQLPDRQASQERVMREVKTLAKLEHKHIVRYYHSWVEHPPPGWQIDQDKQWLREITESRDSLLPTDWGKEFSEQYSLLSKPGRIDSLSLTMPKSESSNSSPKLALPELSDSFIQFKNSSSPTECGDTTEPSIEPQGALRSFIPLNIPSSASESESCEEENITISSEEEDETSSLVPRPTFLYIQMQLCMKESLREWLQRRNSEAAISVNDSINVFHQITLAVEFIHNQNLIHRDLKPSNIFFSIDGSIKIGDFGLVTAMTEPENGRTPCEEIGPSDSSYEKHTANVGTRLYMSPEQILGLSYGQKVDIFSLGLIFYELLVSFQTLMERAHCLQTARDGNLPQKFERQFPKESHLLRKMLSYCPDERPLALEVRQHLQMSSSDLLIS